MNREEQNIIKEIMNKYKLNIIHYDDLVYLNDEVD
jgi:hypothetical protein